MNRVQVHHTFGCLSLIFALAESGCTRITQQRNSIDYIPVRAEQPSPLDGFYQNSPATKSGDIASLWVELTGQEVKEWYKTRLTGEDDPSDIIQLEFVSSTEIRVCRFAGNQKRDSVIVHGRFDGDYFQLDQRVRFRSALFILNGFVDEARRLGLKKDMNLIMDMRGGGLVFFGPIPVYLGPADFTHIWTFNRMVFVANDSHIAH